MKNTTTSTPDFKTMFGQLETTLDLYFRQKAPAMPENVKEFLVKYGPYITAVLMLMTLPLILGLLGLGTLLSPFAYMGGYRYGSVFTLNSLITIVILGMQILALPALFKRQTSGWKMMFYVSLVQAVDNILRFDLGSLVIGCVLSFYVLFQIKSYYK